MYSDVDAVWYTYKLLSMESFFSRIKMVYTAGATTPRDVREKRGMMALYSNLCETTWGHSLTVAGDGSEALQAHAKDLCLRLQLTDIDIATGDEWRQVVAASGRYVTDEMAVIEVGIEQLRAFARASNDAGRQEVAIEEVRAIYSQTDERLRKLSKLVISVSLLQSIAEDPNVIVTSCLDGYLSILSRKYRVLKTCGESLQTFTAAATMQFVRNPRIGRR